MTQKHILVVSQYFYPESFRINDICSEWVKRGYKVTVLTGIPNYPRGKFFKGYSWFKKRKEIWNGVQIIRILITPRGHGSIPLALNYMSFVVSGFFWKCFTRIKADYVFNFEVSPMTQALVGVWYAKRRKIPCFLYVQDLWPENVEIAAGIHNKRILREVGKMVDSIYKRCDKIFATSNSFVEAITKRGVSVEKVNYWPQYAEDFYKPTQEKSLLIPSVDKVKITFTGNIGTAQGLEILPRVAWLLKQRNVVVLFNIVGEGRNKVNLESQIKDLDVADYFNIIGWQQPDDIPRILASSDAAFLSFSDNPLYSMTLPAKLQSYMACGTPIIGVVSGESEEIVREAGCGLVCQVGKAEELCELIIRFIQMPKTEKEQMSFNAIKYVNEHFNKNKLLDEMDRYFEKEEHR